ncbi:hypothetical protein BCR42DRAFT_414148 [Absidia repens]|uniref:Mid2 domain-containing protein n=1 Tax=Absidia repens TaxID=90262 RepID=A0A1X2IIH6_9FUNG|nr:hypothetical protein BCR42DRAFT_414148 [Absidia repens]
MTKSLPLLAILLFLLLLNLVHSLENHTSRRIRKKDSTAAPTLIARGDYSSFNESESPFDQYQKKTSTHTFEATKTTSLNNQPSVTTIIIIQSNGQTYHELGGGPSPTSNGGSNDGDVNDPNESNIQAQVDHDNEVLKRMISISTVVGGVGVLMIIAGTLIFIRLRAKRRRIKAINHYSTAHFGDTDGNDDDTGHARHQRQLSSTSAANYIPPHQHQHQHQHQSPISSPSIPNSPTMGDGPHEAIEMTTMCPSAPPEPTLLPSHIRERHRQSLLSQQRMPPSLPPISTSSPSSQPAPSAPSAKELEMNLPSSSANPTSTHSSPTIEISSPTSPLKQNSHRFDTSHSPTLLRESGAAAATGQSTLTTTSSSTISPSSSSPSSSPPQSRATGPCLHLKPTAGSDGSEQPTTSTTSPPDQPRPPLTPEMPPPAYTPSAPPLYILPPSQRRRSADQLSLDRYRR